MNNIYGEKKLRNKYLASNCGFTLVELVVVLVILAIVAAVAVPSLLGFTDSAKEKQYMEEAKIALTASQSMLSHVYNDNLDYVPQYLRDQAFETSGLSSDTEFLIWTKAKFNKVADGTYNSIAAYTIDSALYKSSDGQYIYYNSSDAAGKESWDLISDIGDVPAFDSAGNLKSAGNLIVVWSSNASLASRDTAKSRNKADSSGISGEGDTPSEKDRDTRFDKNKDGVEEGEDDNKEKMITVNFIGATNSKGKNIVYFDNKTTEVNENIKNKSFSYGSLYGFAIDDDFSVWSVAADENYDFSKLTWEYSIDPGYITDQEGFDSANVASEWLNGNVGTIISSIISYIDDEAEITLVANIEQLYYEVPLRFVAYSEVTQTVDVQNDSDDSVMFKYGRGEGDVSFIFDENEVPSDSIAVSDVNVSSADSNRVIKFYDDPIVNGKWLVCIPGKKEVTYLADKKQISEISGWIKEYVISLNSSDPKQVTDLISRGGITFKACANIYKTIYITATSGSEKHPNLSTFSAKTSTGIQAENEGKRLAIELSETEYDKDRYIYKKSDGQNVLLSKIDSIENYSLFGVKGSSGYDSTTETDIITIYKGTQKVKSWDIYDCDKLSGSKLDNSADAKTQKWDCSAKLLKRLFVDNKNSDAEYAELDTADFDAALKYFGGDPNSYFDGTGNAMINTYVPARQS